MMKKVTTLALSLGLAAVANAQNPPPNPPPPQGLPQDAMEEIKIPGVESNTQKYSYALGTQVGRMMKDGDLEIDMESFKKAFDDTKAGNPAINDMQIRTIMMSMQNEVGEKQLAEEKEWLAENAKTEGIEKTESGLQYKVLTAGDGPKPGRTDRVVAHYHGTLRDGKVFDSSVQRGKPGEFSVVGVIPGWTEALQLMPVGSKWRLFVPSKLAYGPRGRPGIPPNTPLIFEVELLEIKEAATATTPPIAVPPQGLPNAGAKPATATTPPVEVPAAKKEAPASAVKAVKEVPASAVKAVKEVPAAAVKEVPAAVKEVPAAVKEVPAAVKEVPAAEEKAAE